MENINKHRDSNLQKLFDKIIKHLKMVRENGLYATIKQLLRYNTSIIQLLIVLRFKYFHFIIPTPTDITIDPVNMCNLHCPLCPTGTGLLKYNKSMMSFNTFRTIIDKMPEIKNINLYNWGEPFLNPNLLAMVRYAKSRSIKITLDSNFSFIKQEDFFIDIVQSGLDYLRISCDGASQATYSKYRIGGDFNLVINNIKNLVYFKNKLKSATPAIIWKFIVNKYDQDEIQKAHDMASELGVSFKVDPIGLSDDIPDLIINLDVSKSKEIWLPKDKKYILKCYRNHYKKPLNNGPCFFLFNYIFVNPDGKIFPCCFASDESNVFGDLLADSIDNIWNNENYKYSRSLFTGNKYSGSVTKTICSDCTNFKKYNGS